MKNFDEKIRDKIYDAEMPVSDHLWDFIDSQISTNKERPKYWLFFLASLILFPLIFIGFNYYTSLNTRIVTEASSDFRNENSTTELTTELSSGIIKNTRSRLSDLPLLPYQKNTFDFLSAPSKRKVNLSFQIVTSKKNSRVKSNPFLLETPLLNNLKTARLVMNQDNKRIPIKFNAGTPQCPSFRRDPIAYYGFLNGTMSAPFQSLSSLNQEDDGYIQRRNETESGYISYNFDVGLGIQLNDHLFIETGISYNRINNKFYFEENDQIKNTTIITIDTTFDSSGSIVDIQTNTFIVQEQGTTETSALNSFTQLDIPLSIGYRIPITPAFNISASAGAIFNLKTSSKGMILNKKGEPMNILGGISDGQLFKTKVGMSYIGSVKLETELFPKMYVNAGLNMRYYGQSFNSTLNTINQKYFSVGMGAGIRYML